MNTSFYRSSNGTALPYRHIVPIENVSPTTGVHGGSVMPRETNNGGSWWFSNAHLLGLTN